MGPDIFFKVRGEVVGVADIRQCFGFGHPIFSIGLPNNLNAGGDIKLQMYSRSVADATATVCNFVFQWMTRSNTIWTHAEFDVLTSSVSIDVLSQFLWNSRDRAGNIRFGRWHRDLSVFNPLYIRVFQLNAGPLHGIELQIGTREADWSQTETVANFFESCRCAVLLHCGNFPVPAPIISDALSGNCNILDLVLDNVPNIDVNIDELVLALGMNDSLLSLAISNILISEGNWTALCQSLSTHPRLVHLRLLLTFPPEPADNSNERKAHRTRLFREMLDVNTVLQDPPPPPDEFEFDERTLSEVIQLLLRDRVFGSNLSHGASIWRTVTMAHDERSPSVFPP
jgi:hypothetical protein